MYGYTRGQASDQAIISLPLILFQYILIYGSVLGCDKPKNLFSYHAIHAKGSPQGRDNPGLDELASIGNETMVSVVADPLLKACG